MTAEGAVGPSEPVLFVPKAKGSQRFCVDYRKLNKVTKWDSYVYTINFCYFAELRWGELLLFRGSKGWLTSGRARSKQ